MIPLICDNCRREINVNIHPYTVKIELFPRVEESLEPHASEMAVDFEQEIKKIVAKMEQMTDEEVRLEEERVYSVFQYVICPPCRDLLASQFRRTNPIP